MRLLRDPKLFEGFKIEAKLHMAECDKLDIAQTLVARGVCEWIPESEVFEHKGKKLYNGLFGVKKDSTTSSGKSVLRTIMNLTPCNRLFYPLEAGHDALPDIHTWSSIVMSGSEVLETSQSDMSSAFYLFRIPTCWQKFLAFRILVDGAAVGKTKQTLRTKLCGATDGVALQRVPNARSFIPYYATVEPVGGTSVDEERHDTAVDGRTFWGD